MRSTDITVFYSTLRTGALERILKEQGKSLDSAVEEMLDDLYQRIVPEQERTEIEARIRQEEAQTAAETEAARRFAVYRIRELGEDSYFTSEAHNDLYLAACECREYLQDPKPFLLPDYFSHKQICNQFRYSQLVNDLGYNPQITMVVELDADKGMCMVQKAGEDDSWHQYRMKDLSTGIFRAKRKDGRSYAERNSIFEEFIAEREIAMHLPAYDYQLQEGKPVEQRIEEFNAANAPFYIMDYGDDRYGLSLPISFLSPPFSNYGQKAFNAYAAQQGDEAKQNGLFTTGNGYDWECVFKKAFENDPLMENMKFDPEAGGFYSYSYDLSTLEQLGSRFKEICESGQAFRDLVCTALTEVEMKQKMDLGGM